MNLLPSLFRIAYPLQSGRGLIANSSLLKKLDGNRPGDAVAKVAGFSLVVPQDDFVGRSIKYFGELDRKVSWVVERVLQPGDIAIDIGANLGLVSFQMLERVGPTGQVFAFEPQPRMIGYIEKSMAMNGVENLHLQKMGLGAEPGKLWLSIPSANAGAASFCDATGENAVEVPVTTLDDFGRQHDLETVHLVKIDVEGFEFQVVSGGANFFSTTRPNVVIFEENRNNAGDVPESIRAFQSHGYDIFALPKTWFSVAPQPYGGETDAHDFVAIRKDAPGDVRKRLGI